MTLDFDSLYNEASAAAFNAGKKRYYDNRVKDVSSAEDAGKTLVCSIVKGKDTDHRAKIYFDERGGLYDYACDCEHLSKVDGPCKHVIATALAFEEKNPAKGNLYSLKPATNAAALSLLGEYSKKKLQRRAQSGESPISLAPTLCLEGGRVYLNLSIGRDKTYLVRDVSDFVSCMLSGAMRRYGVDLSFFHNFEAFSPLSQKLVRFVIKCYAEKSDLQLFVKTKNLLPLLSGDLDGFFEIYSGEMISFSEDNVKSGLRLLQPEINAVGAAVNVVSTEGGFEINCSLPPFKAVPGKNFNYLITDSRIYRVDDEFSSLCLSALKVFDTHKKLFVSENDMPLFYNNVLVPLSKFLPLQAEAIDLSVFEAPPLSCALYLNRGENAEIAAALECAYDDVKVNILDDLAAQADVVRDWETERIVKSLLIKYFPLFPNLTLSGEEEIYHFLYEGIHALSQYMELYLDESLKKIRVKKPPRIKVGVRLTTNLLDVEFEAEDFTSAQLMEVLSAYREKKNYIRLSDGSFVDLKDSSLSALSEVLEVSEVRDNKLTLPKYYAPFLNNELKNGFFNLERDKAFKSMISELLSPETLDIDVPPSLKEVMRNYQKTGFRWLKTLCKYGFGGILADDMGLGKSIQVIALLLSEPSDSPSIIVCPTTLILNWVNELNKFAPDMKVLPVMGSLPERKELMKEFHSHDVIITSYELIRRDEELYKDVFFKYAVVDEAQFIKNPDTKNSKAVKTLNSSYRFALTGTPIENSLAELWSIFDFIMPRYLGLYSQFREKYESEILRGNQDAYNRLKKLSAPFILRRFKSQVLTELPPKMESNLVSSLEGEQKDVYMANLNLARESVRSVSGPVNKVVVLSLLTKLRQICCEPSLVYPDYAGNSAKLETCLELLQSATEGGHKVLVFSQFTSMLDILRKELVKMDISHFILKGDTLKTERMRLVNRFNEGDTKVFLISLKAGGTGLNLTGADVVIHYDPWWNESVMNQATDRAYRIGQNRSVQVYKLILKDTLEEKIMKLQEKKSALSSLMVGGETPWNIKDIMELLN